MEDKISPVTLLEKVVTVGGKAEAAHTRLDKLEREIVDQLKDINKDLKEVVAWMNRGKGWAAAALLISGFIGGGIATLLKYIFSHG